MKFPPYNPYPDDFKDWRDVAGRIVENILLPYEIFTPRVKEAKINLLLRWVTEAEGKYNLRYWSEGAIEYYRRERACQQKMEEYRGKENELAELDKNNLQHEHVYEVQDLRKRLLRRDPVKFIMDKTVACVVSSDEHNRLDRNRSGWERYTSAGVKVYDLKKKSWWTPMEHAQVDLPDQTSELPLVNEHELFSVIAENLDFALNKKSSFIKKDGKRSVRKEISGYCIDLIEEMQKADTKYSSGAALDAKATDVAYQRVSKRADSVKDLLAGKPIKDVLASVIVCRVTKDEKSDLGKKRGWSAFCKFGDVLKRDSNTGQWVAHVRNGVRLP